jgi:hypothetical protein
MYVCMLNVSMYVFMYVFYVSWDSKHGLLGVKQSFEGETVCVCVCMLNVCMYEGMCFM